MDPLAGLLQAEDEDVGGGSLDGGQGPHGGRLEEHQLGVRRPALDAADDDALGGGHRGTLLPDSDKTGEECIMFTVWLNEIGIGKKDKVIRPLVNLLLLTG